jgi:hypothetical protein
MLKMMVPLKMVDGFKFDVFMLSVDYRLGLSRNGRQDESEAWRHGDMEGKFFSRDERLKKSKWRTMRSFLVPDSGPPQVRL